MATLLNECRSCKMKFENSEQLANHVKKFCQDSQYSDYNKLEEKYQAEMRALKLQKEGLISADDILTQGKRGGNLGKMDLDSIKMTMRSNEDEFKKMEKLAQKKREEEMEDELNRLKEDKLKIHLLRNEDEKYVADLIHELEMRKEKELRARIEKDQIRKALVDLEKTKLTTMETEKKRELEKLANDREILRMKEDELMEEIQRLEENTHNLDKMRQEEINRMRGVQEGLRGKQVEGKKINEIMLQEKSERVAGLKIRREQLENERQRIMDNLEKIKGGDITHLRRNPAIMSTANAILGEMKDLRGYGVNDAKGKLANQVDRLAELKRDHEMMIKRESLSFDGDEMYGREKNKNFIDNANRLVYDQVDRKNPEVLDYMREKIERVANDKGNETFMNPRGRDVSNYADQALKELNVMKKNYADAGGRDQNKTRLPEETRLLSADANQRQGNFNSQSGNMGFPPALNSMISNQVAENQRLRTELDMLKNGAERSTNVLQRGNFALGDINMKLGGFDQGNPFDIFLPSKESFLQNEVRAVDLSEEERVLMSLQAQEVDALRVISRIPIGTELYRFKMEQYKELSTTRAEIEKIVHEQRLQRLRRDFEKKRRDEDRKFDNEKWIDDQRKFIIGQRLRKDFAVTSERGERKYDPTEGMIVHWDYSLGLPRRTEFSQVVFGIYNYTETIYSPKLVEPHNCEIESSQTTRCIYGESHQIFDVPANYDNLLIFEVQLPPSKNIEENVGRTESYGWTQLDLFDVQKNLKRGRWKCPLYLGPTDTSISVEQIKDLEPIPGAWIYLRVSYPEDQEFGRMKSLYPENTMSDYQIPIIHLRHNNRPRPLGNFDYSRVNMSYQQPQYILNQSNQNMSYQQPPVVIEQPSYPIEQQPEPVVIKPVELSSSNILPESTIINQTNISDAERKGISVIVYKVKDHVARSHLRVMSGLLDDNGNVVDDNGMPCAFRTTVHNPLDQGNKQVLAANHVISLNGYAHLDGQMNNKAQGQDIVFQEEYKFLKNLRTLTVRMKKNLYLGFQVLEMPEPTKVNATKNISYQTSGDSANYGGLEFELFGWTFFKINNADGSIKSGRFTTKLFEPPLRKPPLDPDKNRPREVEIEFAIQEIDYNDKMLMQSRGDGKKKKPPLSNLNSKGKEEAPKELDNSPYIINLKSQFSDRPFEKGYGVDFYIDGARFLPDNVTVTKVVMSVFNQKYQKIFSEEAGLPDLNSFTYSPGFFFRRELRKDHFDPTCVVVISLDTVDKSTNEVRIIGYSFINLFINRFTRQQPISDNDTDIVLLNGSYQLPIFCQEPYRSPPFNMEKLTKLEHLPCASTLIRINMAPLSEDGLRTLNIKDFPDKRDWDKKGLWPPKPLYETGVYNTQFCPVRDSEKELFIHRLTRVQTTIRDAAYLLVKAEGISRQMSEKDFRDYLDVRLNKTANTILLEMRYFAKYQVQAGFKFSLDGVHNVPKTAAYVGFYSLNPPGLFYKQPPDPTSVHLNSNLNWESSVASPQFLEGFATFKDIKFNRNLVVVIDIRCVSFPKIEPVFENIGWGILPVFSPDGYVMSGIYQVPLVRGPVDVDLLKEMENTDPWELLQEKINARKSKYLWLEPCSAIVRLLDSQREGHYNNAYDPNRINPDYCPIKKIKQYAYNQAVAIKLETSPKMESIIPLKGNTLTFNHKITEAFATSLNLTQYIGK